MLTTNTRPQPTSVDMNLEQVGRVAARRLFEAIEGQAASGIEELPCRIVTRESSVPVP